MSQPRVERRAPGEIAIDGKVDEWPAFAEGVRLQLALIEGVGLALAGKAEVVGGDSTLSVELRFAIPERPGLGFDDGRATEVASDADCLALFSMAPAQTGCLAWRQKQLNRRRDLARRFATQQRLPLATDGEHFEALLAWNTLPWVAVGELQDQTPMLIVAIERDGQSRVPIYDGGVWFDPLLHFGSPVIRALIRHEQDDGWAVAPHSPDVLHLFYNPHASFAEHPEAPSPEIHSVDTSQRQRLLTTPEGHEVERVHAVFPPSPTRPSDLVVSLAGSEVLDVEPLDGGDKLLGTVSVAGRPTLVFGGVTPSNIGLEAAFAFTLHPRVDGTLEKKFVIIRDGFSLNVRVVGSAIIVTGYGFDPNLDRTARFETRSTWDESASAWKHGSP